MRTLVLGLPHCAGTILAIGNLNSCVRITPSSVLKLPSKQIKRRSGQGRDATRLQSCCRSWKTQRCLRWQDGISRIWSRQSTTRSLLDAHWTPMTMRVDTKTGCGREAMEQATRMTQSMSNSVNCWLKNRTAKFRDIFSMIKAETKSAPNLIATTR